MNDRSMAYVCADTAVFSRDEHGSLHVLLVKRGTEPNRGSWLLPGGHCEPGQTVEQNASRELREETGLVVMPWELAQAGVYSEPDRDPRGWYVSVLHVAVVMGMPEVLGADDAQEARWYRVYSCLDPERLDLRHGEDTVSSLAFDHGQMLVHAHRRVTRGPAT